MICTASTPAAAAADREVTRRGRRHREPDPGRGDRHRTVPAAEPSPATRDPQLVDRDAVEQHLLVEREQVALTAPLARDVDADPVVGEEPQVRRGTALVDRADRIEGRDAHRVHPDAARHPVIMR